MKHIYESVRHGAHKDHTLTLWRFPTGYLLSVRSHPWTLPETEAR